eukprot:COSAG01_NODE_9470_length_2437_cov_98.514970_2_plen_89_part_00
MHWEFYAPDAVRLGSAVTLSRRFVSSVVLNDISPFRLAAQPANNYIGLSRATGPYWLDNSFSCQSTSPAGIGTSEFEIDLCLFYLRSI